MSFKIGFTAEREGNEPKYQTTVNQENIEPEVKRSIVDVYFPDRHATYSYYNDKFDLKCGDFVFVEGKLEGMRGRVMGINYNFKIKLSDYKRIISVADTDVKGDFSVLGTRFITTDKNALKYEQVITWFKAPSEEEFISGDDEEIFNISDLNGMKIDNATADRGYDYFIEGRVVYIELNGGRGRAIVMGKKPYEVEFKFSKGDISGLVCDCYCTNACKHEFAVMLQLKDTLHMLEILQKDVDVEDYLAIVTKDVFFHNVITSKIKGDFSIG